MLGGITMLGQTNSGRILGIKEHTGSGSNRNVSINLDVLDYAGSINGNSKDQDR